MAKSKLAQKFEAKARIARFLQGQIDDCDEQISWRKERIENLNPDDEYYRKDCESEIELQDFMKNYFDSLLSYLEKV